MLSPYLIIGEVLKPQGVRGEVKVRPITCDPYRFEELEQVYFKENETYVAKKVRVSRIAEDAVYLTIEGTKDRNDAEKLRDKLLYIDREHAVELPEDADFICDLIGCAVTDDEGGEWGEITDVMQPGGNDVYVVKGKKGEVLIPALRSVVLSSDVAAKKMLLSAERLREVAVFDAD